MYVVKASGEMEKFDPKKIERTCIRAGASRKIARDIASEVGRRVKNGDSTKKVLQLTLRILKKRIPGIAARYDLKGAILRLGPAGFVFERLIGQILKEYGYETSVHKIIRGACISHEIDVVAAKPIRAHPSLKQPPLKHYMIECKYHNSLGIYTGVRDILYTYARFLDLQEGWKKETCQKFDQPWLCTNTKFSTDAIKYSNCKKIRLLGWKYPTGNSLEDLIDGKKLYPITMLHGVDPKTLKIMSEKRLMLVKDLLRYDVSKLMEKTGLSKNKIVTLVNEAGKILNT